MVWEDLADLGFINIYHASFDVIRYDLTGDTEILTSDG